MSQEIFVLRKVYSVILIERGTVSGIGSSLNGFVVSFTSLRQDRSLFLHFHPGKTSRH